MAPCNLATVPADPVRVAALKTPLGSCVSAPAAFRVSAPVDAVRFPLRMRSLAVCEAAVLVAANVVAGVDGVVVVRAMVFADTVSETVRVWASVRLNAPPVTVNLPRLSILLEALVKLAAPTAEPVRVSAVTAPPDPSIAPFEMSDTCWPVAVRSPVRSNPEASLKVKAPVPTEKAPRCVMIFPGLAKFAPLWAEPVRVSALMT